MIGFGVSNMDLQRRVWNWLKQRYRIRSKELLINQYRRNFERRIYRKKYDTGELMSVLKSMGLKRGGNIFIHSSWDEFYNYTGTIDDFLAAVLSEIGASGTLAMPAYP